MKRKTHTRKGHVSSHKTKYLLYNFFFNIKKPKWLTIVLVVVLLITLLLLRNKTQQLLTYEKKDLDTIEILETVDLSSDVPKFRLHVQTQAPDSAYIHGTGHNPFIGNPLKIRLYNKVTGNMEYEFPVTYSQYHNECVAHSDMYDTVVKWDTDWFSIKNLAEVDTEYTPKLSGLYLIEVLYQSEDSKIYSSTNTIRNVCYQIPKTEIMPPTQEDIDYRVD